jgi:AcrR family transcriptional regulator
MAARKRTAGRPKADPKRDLKADILRISRALLDEGGAAALSMREVARRAGCTHQAPYHYFADRESILAALVTRGFETLTQALRAANDISDTRNVRAAIAASGRAYVTFAVAHASVFRMMFRPELCDDDRHPEVRSASMEAQAELLRLTRIVFGDDASRARATLLWSEVHGLSCLMVDGPLATSFSGRQARQIHLDEVIDLFCEMVLRSSQPQGLVRPAPRPPRRR